MKLRILRNPDVEGHGGSGEIVEAGRETAVLEVTGATVEVAVVARDVTVAEVPKETLGEPTNAFVPPVKVAPPEGLAALSEDARALLAATEEKPDLTLEEVLALDSKAMAARTHIIVGGSGRCMCGLYGGTPLTCADILAQHAIRVAPKVDQWNTAQPAPAVPTNVLAIPGLDETKRTHPAATQAEATALYAQADEAKAKEREEERKRLQALDERDQAAKAASKRRDLLATFRASGATNKELKESPHKFTDEELAHGK